MGTFERVDAVVSMRSVSGQSVFDPTKSIDADRVGALLARLDDTRFVADVLIQQGFNVAHFHPLALSFNGTPDRFRDVFGVRLEKTASRLGRGHGEDVFLPSNEDASRLLDLPAIFGGCAEGVALACPPGLVNHDHLATRPINQNSCQGGGLPEEVVRSMCVEGLASTKATGEGVVAALIGTGCDRHHLLKEGRYRLLPTLLGPGQSKVLQDRRGHSTGEASFLFATVPHLRLRPIKGLLDPVGDMLMTIESFPKPDLIVTSWGYDVDWVSWGRLNAMDINLHNYLRLLEAAIALAVANGAVVVTAAPANGQSYPASHPDVIAISGAAAAGMASHQAHRETAPMGTVHDGRKLPDRWPVGGQASAIWQGANAAIVQPHRPHTSPGLWQKAVTATDLPKDEDWAWYHADQAPFCLVAGLIALVLETHPGLKPDAIKSFLREALADLDKPEAPRRVEGDRTDVAIDTALACCSRAFGDQMSQGDGVGALHSPMDPFVTRLGA